MKKIKFNEPFVAPPIEPISIVDQFPAQEFNITPWGTIRNDLAALAMAQDINEFNAILSRLGEVRTEEPFKGMSDDQILLHIQPRLAQDPAELQRFAEYVGSVEKREIEKSRDKTEPVKTEPVKTEPVKTEPVTTE